MTNQPQTDPKITIPLKRFLLLETRPPDWPALDLYLFRDEEVIFYVGQSHAAFDRVWEHLTGGLKGRSLVGRFVFSNWPVSLKFTVELMSSRSACFAPVGHDLNGAERALIEQLSPCFNEALNPRPTPLPARYAPPTAKPKCSRSLRRLIREAEHAVHADEQQRWIDDGW
ncbi:MAG: hypothetical protein KDD92_04500 [Caldilineaceae bacterium]|nr:hypothetical protein [Caldilineaceae bacterium]